ncbi:hypothetical protein ZIOFF_064702 [Zingiber officinale]|uniref:Uncharacterized protein n=1 Tax=Zingiber officinale TaxID=94328 RepID=A0A8J5EZ27_ZINOF|nr:hypothetical protein ZIOFF_064702 [Zingiber officinale]
METSSYLNFPATAIGAPSLLLMYLSLLLPGSIRLPSTVQERGASTMLLFHILKKLQPEFTELPADVNKNICTTTNFNNLPDDSENKLSIRNNNCAVSGRFKPSRTGLKPYKRCSVEAKENRSAAIEKSGNKRIRLQGEAST